MVLKEDLINYIYAKQRETEILANNKLKTINNQRLSFNSIKKHIDNFINADGEYYNRFIVMPGLRGVGKTTILYQLYDYLTQSRQIDKNNIFYLGVYDLKLSHDSDIYEIFNLFLEEIHQTALVDLGEKIFLFVDEAQLDKNWSKYARLFFDKSNNIFMIFAGSSAIDFEINADETRRITREEIFPCTFQEYLLLKYNLNLPQTNFKNMFVKRNPESIEDMIKCEKNIKKESINLNIEFKKYLITQNFPFALNQNEVEIHRNTNNLVKKIVTDDLNQFKNITDMDILRIISYLATKKSDEISYSKIAQSREISSKTVKKILFALCKTQLIFSILAYGSAGVMIKKPLQHFFLAPSIKAAQNYQTGRYNLNHEKCFSQIFENFVASTLHRLSLKMMPSLEVFYDPKKKGVDFIVKYQDDVIPIEVGIGKKTKSQLTIAMNRYGADRGILISNRTSSIKFENNILYLPPTTFALIS